MKKILRIEINQDNENEFCIDILHNNYNIINKTIYNTKAAKKIIEIIEKEIKEI